ncbi:hypothetical protein WQ57_10175 [Mesobacillus campisalis]|uniref:5'-Nucleotidase C-terminal domain-containing protein n=1 Tax=Mesobacillus campisalis TaxID=1408103 RepID=A0A0M2SZ23_9BACI|nr:hypothetical protein WQ57_10175 [Mesobacillus campisalis]
MLFCLLFLLGPGVPGGAAVSVHAQTPTDSEKEGLVSLQLLGITDFHGYLQALNDNSNGKIPSADGPITVGGGAYIASHLDALSEGKENSVRLSVGDNFSGWPFEVAAHRDEPTIEFLNAIDIELTAAANHEVDETVEFLRKHMMDGKCFGTRGVDSCFTDSTGKQFSGSDFEYLSANMRDAKSGQLILKPYMIKDIPDGQGGTIPVGFIGLNTTETILGTTSYQEGVLTADPLLEAAEKYTNELKNLGVETIIAVVHEGGTHSGYYNECVNPRGPVIDFAREASAEIDAIFTGHWHASFNCSIEDPEGNPRPVIEGSNHGRLISEMNLWIDPVTKDVVREHTTSDNHAVTRDIQPDPEIERMVTYWAERGNERFAQPVAKLTGDITRARNENGESTLANLAADAHYTAGIKTRQPADFALTAASPLKGDLLYKKGSNHSDSDGQILFGEMWNAHGYANPVVVVTLTGRQIDQILEEQWRTQSNGTTQFHPLAVSHNVKYSYDGSKPVGQRVEPGDVLINGKVLDPDRSYRVAALAYLIRGNDGYPTFKGYTNPVRAEVDRFAFLSYLEDNEVIEPPALDRVSAKK